MKALLHSLLDPAVNPAANPSAHPQSPLPGATVLVVGGGAGADLAHWRALQPQRLVVCEPQPALADELQRKLRADAGETLVRGAVAPTEGPLTLQLLNNPRESGVQPPTGLLAHQPRLQVQATLAVPAQTLWQTAEALQLSADAPHLLVLDAPGQASAILQPSLAALQRFEWLVLRTGAEPLYAGDAPCTDLLAMLQAAAYDWVADEPDTLPPHRELLLRRNPQRLQALQTQAALAQAREALQQQQADIAELAAVNAGLEATLAEWVMTIERLEARNQTQAQQLAECQAEVADALAQRDALAVERNQLAEVRSTEVAAKEEAITQQDRLRQQRSKVIADYDELARARDQSAADHETQINAARKAQAAAEDRAAERQAQLETLTQEVAALSQAQDERAKLAGGQAAQIASLQEAKAVAEQSAAQRQEQIDAMARELAELANAREQASQYQAEVAAMTLSQQAHQELAQQQRDQGAAERLAQLESAAARSAGADIAAAEHSAQIHAMTQELAELAKARDEQVQLAGDRAQQIEVITQAKSAAESAATECQAQIDALVQEKAQLLATQEALSKDKADLSQQLQTKAKAIDEQVLRIKAAEAENQDLAARQQLMNDELLKAEAQIELIKDLLLREPGL